MERLIESGVGPEFLLSEANNYRSRENIVLFNSTGVAVTLAAGAILAMIDIGALSAVGAAVAGNTGAATITASPAVAVGTPMGVYKLTAVTAGATAQWLLESPSGIELGNVATAEATTIAGIGPFTITDAGADPAIGDQFTITVTDAAATGEGKYVMHDPEGVNGSAEVGGLLYASTTIPANSSERAVAIVRDAEVIADRLVFDDHDTGEKAAVYAALNAMGVIVRIDA